MGHAFSHHGGGADAAEAEVLKGRVASLEASEAEALAEWAAFVARRPSYAAVALSPPQQHPSCSNRRETGERWSTSRRRRQQQPDGFLCPTALHRLRPLPSGTPSYTSRVRRPGKASSHVIAVHETLPPPEHTCEACGTTGSHGMLACNMCGGRVLCEACSVPEQHAANTPADLVSRDESPQARLLVRLGEEDTGWRPLPEVVVLYSSRGLNTAAAAELALVSPYVSGGAQAGEERLLVTTADWVASSSSSAARTGGGPRWWASAFLRSEAAAGGTRHWEGFFKEGCGAGVASNCVVYLRRHVEDAAGWVRYDAVSDDGVRYCAQRVGGDGDGDGDGDLWSLRHLPCGLLHPLRVAACPVVAALLDGVADEAVASPTVAALRRVSALLAARGARVSLAVETEASPRVRSLRGRLAAAGGARCASGGPTPLLVSLHYAGQSGDAGHFYVAGKTQARALSAADVLRFLSQVADAEEGSGGGGSSGGGLTRRRLDPCQYFNSDMGVLPDRPQLSPTRAAAAAAEEAEEEEGGSPASVAWRRAERAVCVQCRVCGPGAVFTCEADVREHELSEGHLRAARKLRSANFAWREAAEAAERQRAALVRRSVAAAGVAACLLTLRSFLSKRRAALSSARVLLLLAALLAAAGAGLSSVRARKWRQ